MGDSAEEKVNGRFTHFRKLLGSAPEWSMLKLPDIITNLFIHDRPNTTNELAKCTIVTATRIKCRTRWYSPEVLKKCWLDEIFLEI